MITTTSANEAARTEVLGVKLAFIASKCAIFALITTTFGLKFSIYTGNAPCNRAADRVFSSRQAIVIGPVPPGIGVIAPATACTASKSTSPTMPASVREMPTSITAAPGLI
jgi:hypothetical protein